LRNGEDDRQKAPKDNRTILACIPFLSFINIPNPNHLELSA
jgi:hypothetical protein